jgi:hypothetical protein
MKRYIVVAAVAACIASCTNLYAEVDDKNASDTAVAFVEALRDGKFADASKYMNVTSPESEKMLKDFWTKITSVTGPARELGKPKVKPTPAGPNKRKVTIRIKFEKASHPMDVLVNEDGKVERFMVEDLIAS